MGLLVSLKNDPGQAPDSYRQIENWANGLATQQVTPFFSYASGWSDQDQNGYYVDPFGLIHLTGIAGYSGSALAGGTHTIGTLPASAIPSRTVEGSMNTNFSGAVNASLLTVTTTGDVNIYIQSGTPTAVAVYMSGFSFDRRLG